jgi:ATP synthase protein I
MDLARTGKRLAKLSLITQLSLVIVLSTVFFLFFDLSSSISVVTGGTLSVAINAVFAFFTFRFSGASKNQEVVNSMKRGMKIKLFVSVCAFIVIFQIPQIKNFEAVLGYCVAMIAQYPILLTLHRRMSQTL